MLLNWGSGKSHWWVAAAAAVAVVANLGWAGDVWIGPVPVSLLGERIRVVLWGQRSKRGGGDNGLVVLRLALRYRVGLGQCLDGQVQCMRAVLVVRKGCLPAEASCVLTQALYLERILSRKRSIKKCKVYLRLHVGSGHTYARLFVWIPRWRARLED